MSSRFSFHLLLWSCLLILLGVMGWLSHSMPVSYTHLRAHETRHDLVCRLLLEKKKKKECNSTNPDRTKTKHSED